MATCFDGYPMAQAGKAGKALAIGMVASFLGTFFSAILGALLSQKIADIAFALGPWEYFSLCFVAITMVLAISKGNMFKGLASASVGLLFASVGYSPIDAEPRFVPASATIIKGAKNMDNAKLFIDFILSEEVQNIWGSTLTNRPVMKDAATNDAMTPMADINVIEEDIPYVSAHKSELVDKYTEIFTDLQSK